MLVGSIWAYDDQGEAAAGWTDAGFDDSGWALGDAPLGYGDPHIVTTIDFGPNPDQKRTTSYFRTTFEVSGSLVSAELGLMRDDGAVVYLNGVEAVRDAVRERVRTLAGDRPLYQDFGVVRDLIESGALREKVEAAVGKLT